MNDDCNAKNYVGNHLLPERLPVPDADVEIYRHFFGREESDKLFQELLGQINWKQEKIRPYGKEVDMPRLTAWYADAGVTYTYSNITQEINPWTPALLYIRERVERAAGTRFNGVLLNLYRDGRDSVSWHREKEQELGENPVVGSVSFGAARQFQLRHRKRRELGVINVELTHGTLLLMKGPTQQFWEHQIPKTARPVKPRVNLTFRTIS